MDIEKIKQVAQALDGWSYHELKSGLHGRFYLTNRAGLYIQISTVYGEKLEQWRLGVMQKHDQFLRVASIGSDLKKSPSSISRDLVNRLLISTSEAYKKLGELAETYQRQIDDSARDKLIVSTLEKICDVRELPRNYSYELNYALEDPEQDNRTLITVSKPRGTEYMDLVIRDVDLEKVFKIYEILKDT